MDKLKLSPRTRLKYSLIRMKNLVARLPPEIRELTPIKKLVLAASQDLWDLNKTENIDLRDVMMVEEACETLDAILNNYDEGNPYEGKD